MPSPIDVSILSGQLVSSAFVVRADRPMVVLCASVGPASSLVTAWSVLSGTAPFAPLMRSDGTGAIHAIASGTGDAVGLLLYPPTPYGRLVRAVATADVATYTLLERNG